MNSERYKNKNTPKKSNPVALRYIHHNRQNQIKHPLKGVFIITKLII